MGADGDSAGRDDCYPPRELANGELETRFCNVCPIWRWPDIGGNALSAVLCGAEFVNMADHGRYGGPRFAQLDDDYKA